MVHSTLKKTNRKPIRRSHLALLRGIIENRLEKMPITMTTRDAKRIAAQAMTIIKRDYVQDESGIVRRTAAKAATKKPKGNA